MRRHQIRAATVALVVSVGMVACRTAPIRDPDVIRVPSGLRESQVEEAILLALAQLPSQEPDDPSKWFVEEREPGVVFAGYQRNEYYLRTAIRYSTTEVRVEILRSKNLLQSEMRIHAEVYLWISALELKIRVELGLLGI